MVRPLTWAAVSLLSLAGLVILPAASAEDGSGACTAVASPQSIGYQFYLYRPRPGVFEVWREVNDLDGLQLDGCLDETGTQYTADARIIRHAEGEFGPSLCHDLEDHSVVALLDWDECPKLMEFITEPQDGAGAGGAAIQTASTALADAIGVFVTAVGDNGADAADGLPADASAAATAVADAAGAVADAALAAALDIATAAGDLATQSTARAGLFADEASTAAGDFAAQIAGDPPGAAGHAENFTPLADGILDAFVADGSTQVGAFLDTADAELATIPDPSATADAAIAGADLIVAGTSDDDDNAAAATFADGNAVLRAAQEGGKDVRETWLAILPFF